LNLLRRILLPLALLYGLGALLRRRIFEWAGKRQTAPIFSIAIGNLTVGGTGKTPMAIFLASRLQGNKALLSRGYGRKTIGFIEVNNEMSALHCGDEPLEMKHALPETPVAVCENRLDGINALIQRYSNLQTIILDDAFQHLPLRANKYVLLCDFNRPFFTDFPMPAGNLREFRCEARNADAIVITKCPPDLDKDKAEAICARLKKYGCPVFFAHYAMSEPRNEAGTVLPANSICIAVSALANNAGFIEELQSRLKVAKHFSYPDHHAFTQTEMNDWQKALEGSHIEAIVTTRKDFMRMNGLPETMKIKVFVVNTEPKFLFQEEYDFIRVLNC
jgi:tetraacyldisaccharide 4'-kinase